MTPTWMEKPHRRLNPLTGDWVLISPQRTQRPWQGQIEAAAEQPSQEYDPECYLCPGNARAGGQRNPDYTSTFVFDNDFPALVPDTPGGESVHEQNIFVAAPEQGICRVGCFSPRHNLAIPAMAAEQMDRVVDMWCDQSTALLNMPFIRHVQIFENRGAMMGASNPHPHCQIWASASIPNELMKEDVAQSRHLASQGSCLLCAYMNAEFESERAVCRNASFAAIVPFWAVWPFETLVIGSRHVDRIEQLTEAERRDLGGILRQVTSRYDGLFGVPFPYSMGFHQRPKSEASAAAWHFHAHFYPPLLRSATVRKFMVGYELLAAPQRDLTPEEAAGRLRNAQPQE
jgi:UDPglucose--hexose-1-phosphate uridylyltransferase